MKEKKWIVEEYMENFERIKIMILKIRKKFGMRRLEEVEIEVFMVE